MEQGSVNQRLKFLIEHLGLSARAFSELIGESPTNTHNYIGKRNSMPGADYLEKVVNHIENVNPMWLTTGKGNPFLGDAPVSTQSTTITAPKNKGNIQNNTGSHNSIGAAPLDDCRRDLAAAQKEVELLREQLAGKDVLLAAKDDLIAAKEEMLSLLRAGHNRPN
jgi:hypothetical protein